MIRLTLLSLLILSSCTQNKQNFNYSSKELNTLLNAAPIKTIDLDKIPSNILTPKSKKDVIGKNSTESKPFLVGLIGNAISINDINYILDRSQSKIVKTDKAGFTNSLIGESGRGPGEFEQISKIVHNNDYIYILDGGNSKVHLFDHNWNFITSYILKNSLAEKTFEVSEKFMFLPEERYKKTLLKVVSASPPFDEITTLISQLIPVGKQPFSYNGIAVSSNDNVTAISYTSLPFIFIFDEDFRHIRSLHFSSKKINSIENPPIVPVVDNQGTGIRMQSIFFVFSVLQDNNLLVSFGNELCFLSSSIEFDYSLTSCSFLQYADSVKQQNDEYGIIAKYIDQNKDHIIVSSIVEDRAYRFYLEDLRKN